MVYGPLEALARDFDVLSGAGTMAGLDDGELLRRFVERRKTDPSASGLAFEVIVARHGPMVQGILRQWLRGGAVDVDDAFQATFLVLVRKAGQVRVADSLAPWLYGVAYRVALKARATANRRRAREASGVEGAASPAVAVDPADTFDLRPLLYEELNRLPEKYRSPVVLCHLEGKTHEEAARELRWPVGTVSGRLSRARDLLRTRLSRRGLGLTASVVATALTSRTASAVSPTLIHATAQSAMRFAAGEAVTTSVFMLTRGVLTAMLVHKLKTGLIVASAASVLTLGTGYVAGLAQQIGPASPSSSPFPPSADRSGSVSSKFVTPPVADTVFRPLIPQPIPGFPKTSERMKENFGSRNNAQSTIPALRTGAIVLAIAPDGHTLNALSLMKDGHVSGNRDAQDKKWQTYKVPEDVTHFTPIMSQDVLALAVVGPRVKELAAFSPHDGGGWVVQSLKTPFSEELFPTVTTNAALYQAGNDYYAFSSEAKRWDVLQLSGDARATYEVGAKAILLQQGETLFVFNIAKGVWSEGAAMKAADPKK